MYQQSIFRAKKEEIYHTFSSENYHFHSREKSEIIAQACYRNASITECRIRCNAQYSHRSFVFHCLDNIISLAYKISSH